MQDYLKGKKRSERKSSIFRRQTIMGLFSRTPVPDETKPYVDVCSLWVTYGSTVALRDVCLTVGGPGEVLGIIGPNGGGKTTFLKCLLGLVKPHRGSVSLFGLPPEKARKFVGYIPQVSRIDYDFPINVMEVVLMGRLSHAGLFRRYSSEDRAAAEKALKTVGMYDLRNRQIGSLSGGQRQRVFIARALANEPRLLLMDEPGTGLDPHMQDELYGLLDVLKKDMAIILISHDLTCVSRHVDKLACLSCSVHFHDPSELSKDEFISVYSCPVDQVTHRMMRHPATTSDHNHNDSVHNDNACHCSVCDQEIRNRPTPEVLSGNMRFVSAGTRPESSIPDDRKNGRQNEKDEMPDDRKDRKENA